jgi:hypothetical protein
MSNQEQTIQRYLLGELPESEQVTLEQEYFADQQLFEQIVQLENGLVDKYARGLLSPGVNVLKNTIWPIPNDVSAPGSLKR